MVVNYHRKNASSDVRLGSKYLTGDNVVKEIFFSGKSNEIKKKIVTNSPAYFDIA